MLPPPPRVEARSVRWAFPGFVRFRLRGHRPVLAEAADVPKLAIIDFDDDESEAQIAIRHPDGQVLVLTAKAHRNTLTAVVPMPVAMQVLEGSGEVKVSWQTDSQEIPARTITPL